MTGLTLKMLLDAKKAFDAQEVAFNGWRTIICRGRTIAVHPAHPPHWLYEDGTMEEIEIGAPSLAEFSLQWDWSTKRWEFTA